MPADSSDDDNAPPATLPVARPARAERRPLYRVVEFVRDDQGRIQEQGRVWHSDLRRVRQFGRALANNTAGSRVVIADNAGRVVEELALPELAHPGQGQWHGWRERPLPPLPRGEGLPLKREAAVTPAASWMAPTPPGPAQATAVTPGAAAAPALPAPVTPQPPASTPDLPTLGADDASQAEPPDVEVLLP